MFFRDVVPVARVREQGNQRRFLTGKNRDQWEICTAKRITDVFGPGRYNSMGPESRLRDDFSIRIQKNQKFRATPPTLLSDHGRSFHPSLPSSLSLTVFSSPTPSACLRACQER